jgi:hypothetical protein
MTYQHNCDNCRALGTFEHEEARGEGDVGIRTYDLYTCGDSVIARFGDDGPEYVSSLMALVVRVAHKGHEMRLLQEAFRRVAEERGEEFKAAAAASVTAYTADDALGPNAGDATYIAARDAHRAALVLHRKAKSGPYRAFHEQMADEHATRSHSLKTLLRLGF